MKNVNLITGNIIHKRSFKKLFNISLLMKTSRLAPSLSKQQVLFLKLPTVYL